MSEGYSRATATELGGSALRKSPAEAGLKVGLGSPTRIGEASEACTRFACHQIKAPR
jgi:hypothetical protein